MVSNTAVKKLIDEVGLQYEKCWRVLAGMKDSHISISGEEMLKFQPILASALFRLDEMYRALAEEKGNLIARKKVAQTEWFNKRVRLVAKYQEVIKEVIELGKALGDSFAWVFYRNDRHTLERHFQHSPNLHTPSGIGGLGELEFICQQKAEMDYMILYHGITTFLRIGDVSLIDLKKQKVAALGELKSERVGPNGVYVRRYYTGPELDKSAGALPHTNKTATASLPPEMEKKLWKQLDRMKKSFEIQTIDRAMEYRDDTQIEALRKLAKTLEKERGGYEKAGDGLLLMGIRNMRSRPLSSRFLTSSKAAARFMASLNHRFSDVAKQALNIVDIEQTHTLTNANSLFVGDLNPCVMLGTIPLFWRPIPIEFLRKIFFREVTISTIYNPAHLIKRLRKLGYDVELINNGHHHRVSKIIGNSKLEMFGLDYFESLVSHYLMHEDVLVEMFSELLKQAEAGEIHPNSKVTLRMEQH